ncbi:uncharacterized protein [Typha latifolia]|uniref:uncharacterized protein isoform X1 n=1 Tax=Typha latifolia TaxID=4733 RepID=UPI003C2E1EBF
MESVLKRYFGYSQFRPYQREIIEKVLDGRDCLVVMATGSGKSLCYQIPPLITGRTAVVISPLISLMQDQVMSLKQRGIKAEYLASTQTSQSTYSDAEKGSFDILYVTPEKACFLPPRFWANLLNIGICLLAVDEAHCISEWGHDFRKEYKQLHVLRNVLRDVPFIALTATATEKVRSDIMCSLIMSDPYITIGSFDRKNLFYGVKHCNRSMSFLDELVQEVSKYNASSGSTIIYCTTIKDTEQIYESLSNAGIKAGLYHGKMGSKAREESHRSFVRDESRVMVATIAFGMGIDKPNIRCVIHYGCPKSLESYYQESGRCGRDGLASICWLYYSRSDFAKADFYCGEAESENQRKAILESFMSAQKYCFLTTCRRKFLLQYFGENSMSNCGNCDNCIRSKEERDLSRESFLLLSCIKFCGGRWGLNMPIDVLRGSHSKKILSNNYDKLPFHGLGKDYPSNWWKSLGGLLISQGFLKEEVQEAYRFVSVSPSGMQFLSTANTVHQAPLVLAMTSEMIDEEKHEGSQIKFGDLQSLAALEYQEFSEAEGKLYHLLLEIRMKIAKDNGTAPYAICGDQTIKKLTKMRPSTRARLAIIDGVNQHLVTKYGDCFLQNISQLSKELNLPMDGTTTVQTHIPRETYVSSQQKPAGAKFDAWKMWQKDKLSFQEIANFPGRSVPIKEQTVISYVLEAARKGYEISWIRFCDSIELTLEKASQVRCAVTKAGSKDRLKPIKDELPENVTYEHIKTFLIMEELDVSVEEILAGTIAEEVSAMVPESQVSFTCVAKTEAERGNWEACTKAKDASEVSESIERYSSTMIVACDNQNLTCVKQGRSDDALDFESPVKKLHKMVDQEERYSEALEATENAVMGWIRNNDGVALVDILEHFKGSKRDSVVNLLERLEGEFLVFRKNGLYRPM